MQRLFAYVKLARPANIITAIADILLGFAASGLVLPVESASVFNFDITDPEKLYWLILATVGLYGGGVVFNDVFDAELDRVERPERPIPSGKASMRGGSILGAFLLFLGISSGFLVNNYSGSIAIVIAISALFYDWKGKHHPLFGPLNMGACRGANLLLGISAAPAMLAELWFLAFIPVLFIAAITMISRGEVHGGNRSILKLAVVLYLIVMGAIISLNLLPAFDIYAAIPFLIVFLILVFPALFRAIRRPEGAFIMRAVKAGVISLIALDAAVAAGFAGWFYGLMILLLLPISIILAKTFAVS